MSYKLNDTWKPHVIHAKDVTEDGKLYWEIKCPNSSCAKVQDSRISTTEKNPDRPFFSCEDCGVFGFLDVNAPTKPPTQKQQG